MSRNKLGQFERGTCGNPLGRRRKKPRKISQEQLRKDFFEASETLVPIVEQGKRKMVPARVLIERQLAIKAASGHMRAIIEWSKRHEKHTLEYVTRQRDFVKQLLKSEDIVRNFPEDVTDEYLSMTRNLRAVIDPDYLP